MNQKSSSRPDQNWASLAEELLWAIVIDCDYEWLYVCKEGINKSNPKPIIMGHAAINSWQWCQKWDWIGLEIALCSYIATLWRCNGTPTGWNKNNKNNTVNSYYYYDSTAFCWALATFSVSWSYTHLVGLLGWGISLSQGLCLHTQSNTNTE
jgi:hypothetical protein